MNIIFDEWNILSTANLIVADYDTWKHVGFSPNLLQVTVLAKSTNLSNFHKETNIRVIFPTP